MRLTIKDRGVKIIFVVYLLLLIAGIFDYKHSKIPNWLTISGYIGGLLYMYHKRPESFCERVVVSIALLVALYVFFAIRTLGAGDIKLLMMLSIFLNIKDFIGTVVCAFLIAGCMAVIKIIKQKNINKVLKTNIHLAIPIFLGFCSWNSVCGIGGFIN